MPIRANLRTVPEELLRYTRDLSLRQTDVQRRLHEITSTDPESGFAAAPEQSQFLGFLIEIMEARRVLEIGTYTGCSTLAMAMALPDDGSITTCDMIERYVAIGRPFWEEAGVEAKIETIIGPPAMETLEKLITNGRGGTFDFAFIDCNKKDYNTYYEMTLKLLRTGGVIAFDNMYQSGRVLDPDTESKGAIAVRALNKKLLNDKRISLTLLPIEDGMTLVRKRA